MKVISLNAWGGSLFEPLMDFIKQHKDSTDVFCLQEVFSSDERTEYYHNFQPNLLEILRQELDDFDSFFKETCTGVDEEAQHVDFDLMFGNAIFVRKSFPIKRQRAIFIFGDGPVSQVKPDFSNEPSNILVSELDVNDKKLAVLNYHGIAYPGDKLDSPDRLDQSQKILELIKDLEGEVILVGDFNLMPETESVKLLEGRLRNLISEYGVKETRGKINAKNHDQENIQHFADFTFVSKDVRVKSFEVPDAGISDHCPMILEFEI